MKNYGKVISYNKVYGIIKSEDGNECVLLYKNVIDKDIKENDEVEFELDSVNNNDTNLNIARFVRVLKRSKQ